MKIRAVFKGPRRDAEMSIWWLPRSGLSVRRMGTEGASNDVMEGNEVRRAGKRDSKT